MQGRGAGRPHGQGRRTVVLTCVELQATTLAGPGLSAERVQEGGRERLGPYWEGREVGHLQGAGAGGPGGPMGRDVGQSNGDLVQYVPKALAGSWFW